MKHSLTPQVKYKLQTSPDLRTLAIQAGRANETQLLDGWVLSRVRRDRLDCPLLCLEVPCAALPCGACTALRCPALARTESCSATRTTLTVMIVTVRVSALPMTLESEF